MNIWSRNTGEDNIFWNDQGRWMNESKKPYSMNGQSKPKLPTLERLLTIPLSLEGQNIKYAGRRVIDSRM